MRSLRGGLTLRGLGSHISLLREGICKSNWLNRRSIWRSRNQGLFSSRCSLCFPQVMHLGSKGTIVSIMAMHTTTRTRLIRTKRLVLLGLITLLLVVSVRLVPLGCV